MTRDTGLSRVVTVVVAVALLLTACTLETPPTTTSTIPATTSTSITAPGPTDHLEVWVDEARKAALGPFVNDFAEQAGVSVDLVVHPFDQIVEQVLAGERPDLFMGAHDRLAQLVAEGLITPVDIEIADLDPKSVNAVSTDGVLYGVPFGMEAVALYVNTEALGGDVEPDTFVSTKALCTTFGSCVGVPEGLYHNYGFLSASGGYVFGALPDGGWSPDDFGLARAVGGASALAGLVAEGLVTSGPYGDLVERFSRGEMPFLVTGPWQAQPLIDEEVGFTVHPLPTLDGNTLRPFIGVQAFFVSAAAPSALADSFVREVLDRPEVLAAMALVDNRVPALLSARSAIDPELAGFTPSVESGDLLPGVPEMVAVWDPLDAALDQIFAGLDPQAAITAAAAEISQSISP